jgi:hypothetical protein
MDSLKDIGWPDQIVKEITDLQNKVDAQSNAGQLDAISEKLTSLAQRIAVLEAQDYAGVRASLTDIKADVSGIKSDISGIKSDLKK